METRTHQLKMSLISDGELRRELKESGVNVGPITDSTRSLYQRKLQSLKKISNSKTPNRTAPSNQTPGFKRQRPTPKHDEKVSEPTRKRPRVNPSSKPPGWEPTKLNDGPKEVKLYPDLSNLSQSLDSSPHIPPKAPLLSSRPTHFQNDYQSHHALSKARPSPRQEMPKGPPLHNLKLQARFDDSPSSSSYTDESMLFSYESPHSSSSLISEAGTPESPVMSPQPDKEKGLFKVVTNLFESGVSRLLNVSSSFSSPRKKLSEVRKQDWSPVSPHQNIKPVNFVDKGGGVGMSNRDNGDIPAAAAGSSRRYDWELDASDVILCKKKDGKLWRLGKGGFGEVFKGIKDSVDEVAVKRIPLEHYHHSVIEQFKQEIDMISKLRHRHIVQFYGACIQPQNCYMVTELMDSDLFSIMRSPSEASRYKWSGLYGKDILVGVASGLNYLHSRKPPVVHRDMKSPNILVMGGLAKVADVGIARTMGASDMTAQKGYSMAWAAPEVVYRRRATEKIDIWSLGVIIWEVASGKLPRPGRLEMPPGTPSCLNSLYQRCVQDDPTKRPSAVEVTAELKSFHE